MTAVLDELHLTVINAGRRWDPITATHGPTTTRCRSPPERTERLIKLAVGRAERMFVKSTPERRTHLTRGVTHRPVRLENDPVSSPMTYLQAANNAQAAKGAAQIAASHAGDDYAQRQLATAVAQLAEAVEELAKSMHRES